MADRSTKSHSSAGESAVTVGDEAPKATRVESARERLKEAAARVEDRYREAHLRGGEQTVSPGADRSARALREPSPDIAPSVAESENEIDELYDRIINLSDETTEEITGSANEVEALFARLLKLQTAEAESFRRRFEASLEMPIDAGEHLLARAQSLREELEGSAARTAAAGSADSP